MTRKSDPRVDMAYVAAKIGSIDVTIIDCRDESAYADGHIPTARNLPQSTLMTTQGTLKPIDEVARLFRGAGVDGSKPVDLLLRQRRLWRERLPGDARSRLPEHRPVRPQLGRVEPDPNARQESSLANYTIEVPPSGHAQGEPALCRRKELQAAIDGNRKDVVIVDVRAPADYDWGHIPTSVNVFWNDTVDANRKLLSEAEFGALYAKAGCRRTSGSSSTRAAATS